MASAIGVILHSASNCVAPPSVSVYTAIDGHTGPLTFWRMPSLISPLKYDEEIIHVIFALCSPGKDSKHWN